MGINGAGGIICLTLMEFIVGSISGIICFAD